MSTSRRHPTLPTAARPARRSAQGALGVALAGALALALAACSATADAATDDAPSAGTTVLRLKDPGNSGVLAYAKKNGSLDDALAEVGASVEWGGSYASFTATIDALNAGSVNLLEGAVSPAVGYLSTNEGLRIFSVVDTEDAPQAPVEDGLVVPPGSDVTSIEQLVGKKVAVNKAGRGEYLLLLALEQAGLPADAVERVYLNPQDAAAAFSTGKVDAWWAIVRGYPEAVAAGATTLVSSEDVGDQDLGIWAASQALVDENPEALEVFLGVVQDLTEQSHEDPEEFQNVFLDQGPTAVDGERLERDLLTTRYANVPRAVEESDVATVQAVADFFLEHAIISQPVVAEDAVLLLPGSGS